MITYSKRVTDTLRDLQYSSIREAWEVYYPQITYNMFYHALTHGKIPHLIADFYSSRRDNKFQSVTRQGVQDVEHDTVWSCITECAKDLGVSRQAVQLALKRKGRCRGRLLKLVEEDQDERNRS